MSAFGCTGIVVCLLCALKIVYNFYHFVWTSWLGSFLGKNVRLEDFGPWAVITGATDGIGKAYAFELAAKGLNIVLISRTAQKLESVAKQIEGKYGVKTKTIAVDFAVGDDAIYSTIRNGLRDIQVGMLVNNVGMISDHLSFFHETEDNDRLSEKIINCNTMPVVRVTDIVLPAMLSGNKGIIINIASLTAAIPTPYFTVYGATKAFVDKFSRDLAVELEPRGIVVQAVLPGYVLTNMTNRSMTESLAAPSPSTYVKCHLRSLGLENRTAGYWLHKILVYFGELGYFFSPRTTEMFIVKFLQLTRKHDIVGLQ